MTEEERKRLLSQINIISKDDTSNEANQIRARASQQDQNFFADVGRVFEATGAGLSRTLSDLGKGSLLSARNIGIASSISDKLINDLRDENKLEELKSKAKEQGMDTVSLDEYINQAKNTKTSLEHINDFSANTFDKWSNEANQRIAELQGETNNEFTKAVIGFVPNLSQQAVTIGASLINPMLGTSVATGQAMGSYYNDAKSRGMTDEQANDFSQIMGIVEGATEMISVDKLIKAGKGAKALAKGGLKSARKELSKEVITSTFGNLLSGATDNFLQEAITEPIQEGVADWIAGKGNWENIDQRMLEAGINGAITSLITGGANIGVQSAVGLASKTRNGQTATQQEVNQGLVDTLAEIDKLSKEEKQEFIDKYVTPGIQTAQDVVKNEQNQVPIEPNRAVPMQTSENAQQQVQEQEQQVISNQNENALNQNVEPQNLVESAERSGIDVKDENTRKNLEVIQKFNENRGIKATFDADAFKGHDNVNSFFRTDENGNREIVFNPNTMTDKTIQQLAVHEVYHDMVAGGTAQELTDFVVRKMSSNPEYQEYVRALQDVYGEQDSDIIKEEAVAHYLEKNLGTDEFISELQQRGDRTTIQRIIDTIKDMITKAKNTLTGKGDLNYLLDLQRKYEQAYRGEFKGTQEQTKLSKQVNEYQGSHQIDIENSTSLNSLDLNDIESKVKQVNGALSKQDISDLNKLKKLKDNDTITIYRASPVNELNNGDWVTTDKSYAQNVAKENGGKVYSYEVNANELLYPNNVKDLPSLHRLSSFQYNSQDNIQENTISNQPTTDNQGRELSKGQQERLKNTKAVDEDGNVLELYHFTPSGDFTIFDKTRANPESDMGAGFYFTNSEIDGQQNYQDENGADIRNRIARLAEQIENEEDITYEEAREKAEQQVLQGGSSFNVYLDIENPAYIGGENETRLFTQDDIREYAEENDLGYDFKNEEDAYDNALADYVENITNDLYDTYSFDEVQQIQRAIYNAIYENDFEGINVQQLKDKLNDPDNFIEIYDDNGNLVTNEIARQIVENIGYDGIIDNTVSSKFNMNLDPDTTHYIVFRPEQIKNVTNLNPTDNPDINLSKQGTGTSQQIINNFLEDTKVNEGTGTAIKDLARVPVPKTDYKALLQPQLDKLNASDKAQMSEIIDNLDAQGQLNEEAYNSALETINALQEAQQETTPTDELSVNLKDGKYGKFDSELSDYRNRYNKGQLDYNKNIVNDAMELVPGKKIQGQQKRTKAEWLRIAQHIGQDIANLSDQEVKDTAYATWLDLAPNNKNTLNREGGKYVDFKNQEWNNAIYDAVKQNRTETTEPVRQVAPSEAPAQVPQATEVKQRQVEPIRDITDVERPQVPQNQKTRKTYESIINSNQMTQEAKQVARELMGYDTYVPQTNKFTLEQADRNIKQNGVDESLTTLTNKINNNNKVDAIDIATGERLIEYYSKIGDRQKLQEAIQSTAMAGTEAGRAVQAMSMINHQTPIGQVTWIQRSVDKVNKRLAKEGKPQFNFTPEMQQKILNSTQENLQKNLDSVYRELGQQVPKSAMEKFNEWRYFSMLANPKTHIRNILGNVVMGYVQRAKNKVAGTIEDFVIGDNAERWNSLKGASKGMYEFAKNDLKNADVQSMLGLNENKYNPQNRLQQNQRTFKNKFLEGTLGKAFELNSKALEVEDGWGLKSGYAKAMANYLNANKLDYNNLTDAQLQKARNYAVQQAKEATFHQENTVANVLQTWENKNLFTKVALGGAIPFKKTPMNVALTGFEYSPAGFAKTLTMDLANLRKGKISANQFIDNISKNLTGTGISLLGYGLTQAGILKASGSGDEDKDEFEEATGKQNYSIQIGDKTYSLDWLTPAGIPLFIGSELYQVSHQKEDGNKTKNENEAFKSITKILDATASAMNPMSEMTMISGLTNALKSYAQGSTKSIENMLANVGKSYVTQTVPTALGQIARSTDQYERSTTSTETDPMAKAIDSAKNQIISKIPGLRETLPVSTDVWGNERETQSYEENAILPWTSKEISKDPVNKALTDLYDATGESSVLPDNYIDKSLTIDKEKYKLTNEEYARLKQQYGKTAHDILSDLTKSKEYEQMSDEQKVKAVKEAYSYAKSTLKVTYSDENNLDAEESSTYKKVQSVIDNGGDAKEYFEYTGLIDGVKKEKEKRQILLNSNIKDKGAIYESTIGSDDETYQIMKATGIDPDAYLEYKQQDFSSDKEDDGTVKGKTVSGSGKTKFYDYMDNANMTYEQKLLLTGMKYKLLPGERDTLANYIDTLPISASEKTDIYKKLKGATVYQNGEIYY